MSKVTVENYSGLSGERVYGLGRNLEHDEESKRYLYRAPNGVEPKTAKHQRYAPVFNQGQLGSCTGNAGLGALGTGNFYETVKALTAFDQRTAVSIYSDATKVDEFRGEYPPTDTGSSGLGISKVLTARKLISGYKHAVTWADALVALSLGPVITGVKWYSGMDSPDTKGFITARGSLSGGHEFVVDEIDVENEWVGCTNSWGNWGTFKNGRFFMSFKTWQGLLNQDGDVTVFVPLTAPAPIPTPTPPPATDADSVLNAAFKAWQKAKGLS